MSVATVVQSGPRRWMSIRALALIAVLGAAVVTAPRARHHPRENQEQYREHTCGGLVPTEFERSTPSRPAAEADPCPAALAAWAAVRNLPDVPSGTMAYQRAHLRNLAIEACRAPHQP